MIGYLKGTVIDTDGRMLTLNVGGVGYEVMMPQEAATLFEVGAEAEIYTVMHLRENEIGLYGFTSVLEKKVFNLLIGVSGVGPKSAAGILGAMEARELLLAIHSGDERSLSKLPGIGKKTAARMVLELAEKVEKDFAGELVRTAPAHHVAAKAGAGTADLEKDLADALTALGYHSREIEALFSQSDILQETSVDTALRKALQLLSRS
jgi:Holliday junction DNA helicase RuvA